jgi:EpsI family protein
VTPRAAFRAACGLLLAGTALSLVLGVSAQELLEDETLDRPLAVAIPLEHAGWRGVDEELEPQLVASLKLDDVVRRRYTGPGGETVVLYVAYHGNKRRGMDTIYHNPTVCFPSQGFEHVSTDLEDVTLHDKALQLETCRYVFASGPERLSVLTFFKVGDELLDQSPRNKAFWLLSHKLLPDTPGAFVQVQVITRVANGDDYAAADVQHAFLQAFGRPILEAVD